MPSLLSRFLFAVAVLPELELEELLEDELLDELLEDELGFDGICVFAVSEPPHETMVVIARIAETRFFMWAPEDRFGNPLIHQTKTVKTTNLKFK